MSFNPDDLIALFTMAIPMMAVSGCLTLHVARIIARQRRLELVYRERLAAFRQNVGIADAPPIRGDAPFSR